MSEKSVRVVVSAREATKAIDAVADYCTRLPDGYLVKLHFSNKECWLEIEDENGDELELDSETSLVENWPKRPEAKP